MLGYCTPGRSQGLGPKDHYLETAGTNPVIRRSRHLPSNPLLSRSPLFWYDLEVSSQRHLRSML